MSRRSTPSRSRSASGSPPGVGSCGPSTASAGTGATDAPWGARRRTAVRRSPVLSADPRKGRRSVSEVSYLTGRRGATMPSQNIRRDILKGSLALAGLSVVPEWMFPVLAQGETLVPFTDLPEKIVLEPTADRRIIDIRTIDGPFTPKDRFFTTQHYGHPEVDPSTFRLKVSGLVERPKSLSLEDLRKMGGKELIAGFECSGNRPPLQGLSSNGRWTGVPLRAVLDQAGVKPQAREFVFFGADHGEEEVEFRTQKYKVDQQYGRSLSREHALSPEPFLAYALNGEPLTRHQGAPLRLIVPGWYGAPNVKWLAHVHAQEHAYLGKFQARHYRTRSE